MMMIHCLSRSLFRAFLAVSLVTDELRSPSQNPLTYSAARTGANDKMQTLSRNGNVFCDVSYTLQMLDRASVAMPFPGGKGRELAKTAGDIAS